MELEPKAPGETRNYLFDWSAFLGEDTIATSDVQVSGVTLVSDTNDDTSVTVRVSGGTAGTVATITNAITTAGGLIETEVFQLVITSASEPVSLSEAKAQCRMTGDDSEDSFIQSLIPQARAYVEKVSTYSLVPGTRDFTFGSWGDFIEVYIRPVLSVASVAYVDESGADVQVDAVDPATVPAGFLAPLGRYPLRIYPAVDTEFAALAEGGTITVTLAVGALEPSRLEYLIAKRAILLLIAHWFEYREAAVTGAVSSEVAFAVKEMLDTLRPVSAY